MLSIHPEEFYATRVLRSGASGYLSKRSAPSELVTAIRTVAQGRKYITASLAEKLAESFDGLNQPPHQKLSDREYQVLIELARGNTISEIAEILNLSVNTISTYRSRILEKMNLNNTAELIHYAIQNKLVES
jgi:DNA-binding NarL/FixJ family response regulator